MPDTAATALAPTGPSADALASGIAKSEANIQAAAAGERKVAQKGVTELEDITKEGRESAKSFEQILATLRPPELGQAPKPPAYDQTNPVKAWGSSAMMVAALASLFTRTPLTTAFKSAGAALDAFREGDIARANAAFQKWKIDTDNYFKMADYQMRTYDALLGNAEARAKLMSDEYSTEAQNKREELSTLMKAFGDTVGAEQSSLNAQLTLLNERRQQDQFMAMNGKNIEESFAFQQGMREWQENFKKKNGRDPTGDETIEKAGELQGQLGHAHNDVEVNSAVDRSNARAATYAKNAGFTGAFTDNTAAILGFDMNRPPDRGEVIRQAAALDAFVQKINGNKAIRSFQLQLLQKDMGVYNRFQHFMQQLGQGGPVTRDMIQAMQEATRAYMHLALLGYGEYITSDQWRHWKLHYDPTDFVPPDFRMNDDPAPETYPEPPQAAIDYLKANPTRTNWIYFDQHFGQSAAANVFGEGPGD